MLAVYGTAPVTSHIEGAMIVDNVIIKNADVVGLWQASLDMLISNSVFSDIKCGMPLILLS